MEHGQEESSLLPHLHRMVALFLIHNPHATNSTISQNLGKHINTIAPIVQELKKGVLSESFNVLDWDAIGLGLRYRVDILINQRKLLAGGGPGDIEAFRSSEFAKKRSIQLVEVNSQERLARFIMHQLIYYVTWRLECPPESKHDNAETVETLVKIKATLKNFSERIYVENVTILLGHQADLSVAVRVNNSDIIRRFVTDGLRLLGGINNTSTSQEVWSSLEP